MTEPPIQPPSQPDATAAPLPRRRWVLAAAALLAVAIGAGIWLAVGRDTALENDPAGASACKSLASWLRGEVKDPDTGKPASRLIMSMTVSADAKRSTTPAIRAAAGEDFATTDAGKLLQGYGGPSSFQVANVERLHSACIAAGVKMPAFKDPA